MKNNLVYLLIAIFCFTTSPCFVLAYQSPAGSVQDDSTKQMLEDMPQDEPVMPPEKAVPAPKKQPSKAGARKTQFQAEQPQTSAVQQADICASAKKDAEKESGGTFWLWSGMGCLGGLSGSILGLVAVICGYAVAMPVPAMRIIGKSPDYVLVYTFCYQEQTKAANGGAALFGCVAPYVVLLIGGLIYLAYTNQL